MSIYIYICLYNRTSWGKANNKLSTISPEITRVRWVWKPSKMCGFLLVPWVAMESFMFETVDAHYIIDAHLYGPVCVIYNMIPYQYIPCHTLPYSTILYHTPPYIPYSTIQSEHSIHSTLYLDSDMLGLVASQHLPPRSRWNTSARSTDLDTRSVVAVCQHWCGRRLKIF